MNKKKQKSLKKTLPKVKSLWPEKDYVKGLTMHYSMAKRLISVLTEIKINAIFVLKNINSLSTKMIEIKSL